MLIIRETEYAIRTIRALSDKNRLNIRQICSTEDIPVQFAYKILKKLGFAGILEITRGAGGGYRLVKAPDKIRLYDVLLALDGRGGDYNSVCECLEEDLPDNSGSKSFSMYSELYRLNSFINEELKNVTLDRLI